MEATIRELARDFGLNPAMTEGQVSALIAIAGIEPLGLRRTGLPGHPPAVYDSAAVLAAHATEAARTDKQFTDSDWLAHALLGRGAIRADAMAGELWWPDGTRAEQLTTGGYGCVRIRPCAVPAHRVIWIAAEGPIPAGLQINHINKLRWDNRRANLEVVSYGNNVRHALGQPYITYHDALRELAELEPQPATIDPYGDSMQCGRVIAGPRYRRLVH